MKQPKCPTCGSVNVLLIADLEEVNFYIDENGNVDFELRHIRDKLEDCLKNDYVGCECTDCGESWSYEEN